MGITLFKPKTITSKKAEPRNGLPPYTLLNKGKKTVVSDKDIDDLQSKIIACLDDHNATCTMHSVDIGASIMRFNVVPGKAKNKHVKASAVMALEQDVSLSVGRNCLIKIVDHKPFIGVYVPIKSENRGVVSLSTIAMRTNRFNLPVGIDVTGKIVTADLTKLPHLLVAGATGAGKSVALNSLITGLVMNNKPEVMRLILIDPKRVEFTIYKKLPHLKMPVITDTDEAVDTLKSVNDMMDKRYEKFEEVSVRNIEEYNQIHSMPYIVVIIDELADILTNNKVAEGHLVRLAQLARATGIHLIVATQRPSVDVITGLIKANFPARLAFTVSSRHDSQTILGSPGAEKLTGKGDALFKHGAETTRIQSPLITSSEIRKIVEFWSLKNEL